MDSPFRLHQSSLAFSIKAPMKRDNSIYQSKKKPSPSSTAPQFPSCSLLTADKNYPDPLSHSVSSKTLNNITPIYLSQENQARHLPKKTPRISLPNSPFNPWAEPTNHILPPHPFPPQNPLLSPFIFPSPLPPPPTSITIPQFLPPTSPPPSFIIIPFNKTLLNTSSSKKKFLEFPHKMANPFPAQISLCLMSARKKVSTKVCHVEKPVLHRVFLCRMLFVFVLQDGQLSGMVVGKGDFEERGW